MNFFDDEDDFDEDDDFDGEDQEDGADDGGYGDEENYDEEYGDGGYGDEENAHGYNDGQATKDMCGESVEGKGGDSDGKTKGPNIKKMMAIARGMGIPSVILPLFCPKCHQHSLFFEKKTSSGIRILRMILQGCIGAVNVSEIPGAVRFICLNPKCKSYYRSTGDKFKIGTGGKLELSKNLFYIKI